MSDMNNEHWLRAMARAGNAPETHVAAADELAALRAENQSLVLRLEQASKVIAELEDEKRMLSYQETAARTRFVDAEGRLDSIRHLFLHACMNGFERLEEANRIVRSWDNEPVVETAYPPDHQRLDVYGDCKCAVCRPVVEKGSYLPGELEDLAKITHEGE